MGLAFLNKVAILKFFGIDQLKSIAEFTLEF